MSKRVGLALIGLALFASNGHAQKDTVALFVATTDPSNIADSKPIVEAIEDRLKIQGRPIVAPFSRPAPSALKKADLLDVRGIGQDALRDLADDTKAGVDLAEIYEPRIAQALSLVSAVQAPDARALLWNICILRVQLLIRQGRSGGLVESVARDCRRLFVDQSDFGRIWQPEVVASFRRASAGIERVPLGVQSSPAGCTVLLNGAAVGTTPARLDVQKGRQDVQLACDGRMSRIHSVLVTRAQDVVIRLDGDIALLERSEEGAPTMLTYPTSEAVPDAIDHAGALAAEARADTFIVISDLGANWRLDWGTTEGDALSSTTLPRSSSPQDRETAIESLFRPGKPSPRQSASSRMRMSSRRTAQDFLVGGALVAGGVATSIFPLLTLTANDRCSGSCSRYQSSSNAGAWGVLGLSGVLIASGASVIWAAPFGRRQQGRADISLGLGSVHFKGTFQ